jgi:hypothetical protein
MLFRVLTGLESMVRITVKNCSLVKGERDGAQKQTSDELWRDTLNEKEI